MMVPELERIFVNSFFTEEKPVSFYWRIPVIATGAHPYGQWPNEGWQPLVQSGITPASFLL